MSVLGVLDEQDAMTRTSERLRKISGTNGANRQLQSHHWLGHNEACCTRKWAFPVTMGSKGERDNILGKSPALKERGAPCDKVYISEKMFTLP